MRPIGVPASATAVKSGSPVITDVRSVAIIPGDTQLARMVGAYSSAAVAVRFTTPALAAL